MTQTGPFRLPRGGRLSALAQGLVGLHFYGDATALEEKADKD